MRVFWTDEDRDLYVLASGSWHDKARYLILLGGHVFARHPTGALTLRPEWDMDKLEACVKSGYLLLVPATTLPKEPCPSGDTLWGLL